MLREIIRVFQKKDVVQELSAQIGEMLEAGEWMFDQATKVLMREQDWRPIADQLYERDQQINRLEQKTRERIVTHLSVSGHGDLAACLALMNVVKDAERIGDYCKNIFEVGRFYTDPYQHAEYAETLDDIRKGVLDLFCPTRKAFLNLDADVAAEVMSANHGFGKQCDTIIHQLLRMHDDFAADEAVAYVLLARHYKRVGSHLSNIASSVVSPVPKMDFRKS